MTARNIKDYLVAIAAFNEEKNIGQVVKQVIGMYPEFPVLVVDDGSDDNTGEIAKEAGAIVIKHAFNMGIGSARHTGYRYALENNYNNVIQLDGDRQHNPFSIRDMIEAERGYHVINGSRFLENYYKMPFLRNIGRMFFSRLFKILFGVKITDPTSGYRLLTRAAIEFLLKNDQNYFDYPEVESLEALIKAGYKVSEVQVKMEPRLNGRSSINIFQSIYYMIKVSISFLIMIAQKESK